MGKFIDRETLLRNLQLLKNDFQTWFTYQGNKEIGTQVYDDPTIETEYIEQNNTRIDIVGDYPGLYCYYAEAGATGTIFFETKPNCEATGSYYLANGSGILTDNVASFDAYCWQRHYTGTLEDVAWRGVNPIQAAPKTFESSYQDNDYTCNCYDFITYIQMPVFDDLIKGDAWTTAVGNQLGNDTTENWQAVIDALGESLNPAISKESGGGGGQFGGGSGWYSGGAGGGSGFIGNPYLYEKCMYGYDVKESSFPNTKTISVHNVSETGIAKYAKKGDGFARITFLGTNN